RTGQPADGEVVVIGAAATIRGAGDDVTSEPGALGDEIARSDRGTAAVGSADMATLDGLPVIKRPAAVGAMTSSGSVDLGAVDESVLVADPTAPFGVRVDEAAFVAETVRAMDSAALTILDPGELDRAYAYGSASSEEQYDELRQAALRRTDALLGAIVDELPPDTMLLVVAVTPPSSTWELTPLVAYGAGVHPGRLVSPSTQRADLVTLTDVSATVLEALGLERPDGMIGRPLEYQDGAADIGGLAAMNDVATGRERVYYPVAITFIVMQALVYLAAILILSMGGPTPTRFLQALRFTVVTFAAWPLATFLVRIVPDLMTLGVVTHLLIWAVALALAALAVRRTGHPLAPLQLLAVLTMAVLLVDVSTGSHLLQSSILGYSPHTSNRYTGFGNTAYAVLAPCALIAAVLLVDRSARRKEALLAAGALLGLVIVIDGAPWLGSDVGGILSLVPVCALLLAHLSGRRVGTKAVVLAGVATAVVLAVAVGADLLRSPSDQTHFANAFDDGSNIVDTLQRRWSANVRIFGRSVWTWMVPIIAVLGVYVLVIARGWRRLLPAGSPLRAGVMGLFAASVLGWLVNDSGVVVTALFLVFIGPYLTLVVIADRFGGPQLLEPAPVDDEPGTGAIAREVRAG
ncbi:MAG TPA: hypothetical protein VJ804_16225, partial [Acidimicrobiales bacterium]|nr:hypothetical protein [Acidimicrobiales bacterium]